MKQQKGIIIFSLLLLATFVPAKQLSAQDKFYTKGGKISFVSKGVIETIEATHRSVTCVLDTKTGNIQFSVLMKGFEFRKALMQEHFNENYVESDKYPSSVFKGQITNVGEINFSKDGVYPAKVKGTLTLHGESKEVTTDGKITVKGGNPQVVADFTIQLSDYKISIPAPVKDNMSNSVKISVDCMLEPLKS